MEHLHNKDRIFRRTARCIALAMLSFAIVIPWAKVSADPHAGQSQEVVIIGGATLDTNTPCLGFGPEANNMSSTGGGCLPVTGAPGELGDFNFTAMDPPAVSAASLAPFDTAVLNMASTAMACSSATLTAVQQADLVAFVDAGKKLIIFDSECSPGVDYSWLQYPFTTANPGALGQFGTLTVVEDNLLSTDTTDPDCTLFGDTHCIDVTFLGGSTDAVGDMNVATTLDPNWCVDMSGTNAINITGAVHIYANSPSGTDFGLIIYNGLDQDFLVIDDANLRKIWVQELQQPFNPSGLPCRIRVIRIDLDPKTDANFVGEDHTVTATLTDLLGVPQPGIPVTFTVLSGPNAGAGGTCSVNADCTSDANGLVSFTYTGAGGTGTDEIEACFINQDGIEVCALTVTKDWLVVQILIDIKPGSDPNCFNNNGNGVIPVAILGSDTFDVGLIDPATLSFEGMVVAIRGKDRPLTHVEDVNGDGFPDLVVQFEDVDGIFTQGDGTATVTGQLTDGTPFEGSDSICITQ